MSTRIDMRPTASSFWWDARLWEPGPYPWSISSEIGRGSVAELVTHALSAERGGERRLFLVVDGTHEHLDWDEMQTLAGRPDFPMII